MSAFNCTSSGIDKPLERSFGSIYKWLQRGFRVDPETHLMTVHGLVNCVVDGEQWELMIIHNTAEWQKYMQAALERGWSLAILVQTREKPQPQTQHGEDKATTSRQGDPNYVEEDESEQIENQNIEPQGLADEGERIQSIVEEMEAEDQAAMDMEEDDWSSDDEQYALPKEWKEHGFGNPVVEDVRHQEWEYKGNEVVQGATYPPLML